MSACQKMIFIKLYLINAFAINVNWQLIFILFIALLIHVFIIVFFKIESLPDQKHHFNNLEIFFKSTKLNDEADSSDHVIPSKQLETKPLLNNYPQKNTAQVKSINSSTKPHISTINHTSKLHNLSSQNINTNRLAAKQLPLPDFKAKPISSPSNNKTTQAIVNNYNLPHAAQLINSSKIVINELNNHLNNSLKNKYINANTKDYKYTAYMEAWRIKIEKIGNFNYPVNLEKRDIYGNLIVDVTLNAHGKVLDIAIIRSSGHKFLDDSAMRIVQLAAPFAPFPNDIRQETDILHIVRTWQFRSGRIYSH